MDGKFVPKANTNTGRVLEYLKTHKKGITSMEAFERFGCTRLSGIIYNLRGYGYKIESIEKEGKNRYKQKVRFVQYCLNKD